MLLRIAIILCLVVEGRFPISPAGSTQNRYNTSSRDEVGLRPQKATALPPMLLDGLLSGGQHTPHKDRSFLLQSPHVAA